METFIRKVNDVVACASQPPGHGAGKAHIREEPHANSLSYEDLLLGKPRRVLESLPDIFDLQIRVVVQYLLLGGPMRKLADYQGNGDPHAADARTSSQDFGIKCDSFKHIGSLMGSTMQARHIVQRSPCFRASICFAKAWFIQIPEQIAMLHYRISGEIT
jgi:hypothetical protein